MFKIIKIFRIFFVVGISRTRKKISTFDLTVEQKWTIIAKFCKVQFCKFFFGLLCQLCPSGVVDLDKPHWRQSHSNIVA